MVTGRDHNLAHTGVTRCFDPFLGIKFRRVPPRSRVGIFRPGNPGVFLDPLRTPKFSAVIGSSINAIDAPIQKQAKTCVLPAFDCSGLLGIRRKPLEFRFRMVGNHCSVIQRVRRNLFTGSQLLCGPRG